MCWSAFPSLLPVLHSLHFEPRNLLGTIRTNHRATWRCLLYVICFSLRFCLFLLYFNWLIMDWRSSFGGRFGLLRDGIESEWDCFHFFNSSLHCYLGLFFDQVLAFALLWLGLIVSLFLLRIDPLFLDPTHFLTVKLFDKIFLAIVLLILLVGWVLATIFLLFIHIFILSNLIEVILSLLSFLFSQICTLLFNLRSFLSFLSICLWLLLNLNNIEHFFSVLLAHHFHITRLFAFFVHLHYLPNNLFFLLFFLDYLFCLFLPAFHFILAVYFNPFILRALNYSILMASLASTSA